jgi:hypothetical protein
MVVWALRTAANNATPVSWLFMNQDEQQIRGRPPQSAVGRRSSKMSRIHGWTFASALVLAAVQATADELLTPEHYANAAMQAQERE